MTTPLEGWLRRRLAATGPVPFRQFMAWALFHPDFGYYAAGRVRVGHGDGDFTTAPHLSPLFARCLARLVVAADRGLGHPDPFTLVEGGPGEGRLARDLLDALGETAPELYARLRYAPDEASPALARRQAAALAPHAKILASWVPEGGEPVTGLYLSNELLDAFPVHRLTRRGGELAEVHVAVREGALEEVLAPPSRPDFEAILAAAGVTPGEGYEVEWSPELARWLHRVARGLARGYLVTIDYGDEAARLFGPGRPRGTVAAYRRHRLAEDLLAEPGHQDLTAHVNFTALRQEAERCGFACAPLLGQREFLFALGLAEEVAALEEQDLEAPDLLAARRALAPLLFPDAGMGEAFRALVGGRGAPLEALPLTPWHPEMG